MQPPKQQINFRTGTGSLYKVRIPKSRSCFISPFPCILMVSPLTIEFKSRAIFQRSFHSILPPSCQGETSYLQNLWNRGNLSSVHDSYFRLLRLRKAQTSVQGSGPHFPRCCKDSKYAMSLILAKNPAVTSGQPDRVGPCYFPLEFKRVVIIEVCWIMR